jgi:hypothetical protein
LLPLRDWYPADVLHFPFRSLEQWERKGVRRARGDKPLGQYVKALEAAEKGRSGDLFRALVIDDERLASGLRDGNLTLDTRLRDVLRGGASADYASAGEELRAVAEAAALREANVVRLHRRLDVLAGRLADVEERPWARPGRLLRRSRRSAGKTTGR